MKHLLFISFLIIVITEGRGQNLVPNPSFEELQYHNDHHLVSEPGWYRKDGKDEIKYWFAPTKYSASLVSGKDLGKTGNIAARFLVFNKQSKAHYTSNYRQYYGIRLTEPLVANEKYEVTYYVREWNNNFYAVNGFGYLFSKDSLAIDTYTVLDIEPDHISEEVLHSTERDWIKVESTYTAKGGEEYIIFGNFLSNRDVKVKKVKWKDLKAAEYYLDDISVVPVKEIRPY